VIALLLAQATQTPTDVLLQYGAIGAILVVAIGYMGYLQRQNVKQHNQSVTRLSNEIEAQRARADRLELALERQNTVIQDRVVPLATELGSAAEQIATVTDRLVDQMERQSA
jgi:hypothetical protein